MGLSEGAKLYVRRVLWSDEDDCFIGMCPELMYGGVHGDDAVEVFQELSEAIEEVIEIYKKEGKILPQPRDLAVLEAA